MLRPYWFGIGPFHTSQTLVTLYRHRIQLLCFNIAVDIFPHSLSTKVDKFWAFGVIRVRKNDLFIWRVKKSVNFGGVGFIISSGLPNKEPKYPLKVYQMIKIWLLGVLKANIRPQNNYFRFETSWKSENGEKLKIRHFGQHLTHGNCPIGLVLTQRQVFWGSMSFICTSPSEECNAWHQYASLAIAGHETGRILAKNAIFWRGWPSLTYIPTTRPHLPTPTIPPHDFIYCTY